MTPSSQGEQDPFYAGLSGDEPEPEQAVWAAPGQVIEPIEIAQTEGCSWQDKPCAVCGKPKGSKVHTPKKTRTCEFKGQRGCASCGRFKKDSIHFGTPPSINLLGSGNPQQYQTWKGQWQELLLGLLRASELPRGLQRVTVEGVLTFPRPAKKGSERDQGNFRVLLEKALGDALEEGGYLPNDSWAHYSFGNLDEEVEDGVARTRLMLFATAPSEPEPPAQASLL